MTSMVEKVADAMEAASFGYSMSLIRLVDGVSTYSLKYSDGECLEFSSTDELYEHVAAKKRLTQALAAIEAMKEPTANMSMVGLVQSQRDDINLTPQEVDDMWFAMITAALSEESTS